MSSVTEYIPDTTTEWIPFLPALLFLVVAIVHSLVAPPGSVLEFCLCWLPPILLIGSALGIQRSSIPSQHYPRILGWAATGFTSIGLIIGVLLIMPDIYIDSNGSLIAGLGIGTVGGMITGYNEARALERGRVAERERLAAKQAEEESTRLEHLNHLLRHDILNSTMVIKGYADLLGDDLPEEKAKRVQVIQRQAQSIEELIQNVRSYLQAAEEDTSIRPTNLSETLRDEIDAVQSAFPELNVTSEVPDEVTVAADPLLGSVFSNLFRNAAIHNQSDDPELEVLVDPGPDSVTIRVRDDGPGIPKEVQQELTTPPEEGHHGFGLYLVQTLVNRYGGTLEFKTAASDQTGTTIIVTLPRPEGLLEQNPEEAKAHTENAV